MKILKTLTAAALLSGSLSACAAPKSVADSTPQTAPMVRIFELGVQPDKLAQFDAAAHANLTASVGGEDGTLAMHAIRLADDPNTAYLFEIYRDEAAYQVHVKGKPYQDYLKLAPQLLTDKKKFTATETQFIAEKPQPIALKNNERFPRLNFMEVVVKAEHNAAFRQIVLAEMAQSVKTEAGVQAMYAATAKDQPNKWFFVEIYRDDKAYQQHRTTPHFQQYLAETNAMIESKTARDTGWKLLMSKGGLRYPNP